MSLSFIPKKGKTMEHKQENEELNFDEIQEVESHVDHEWEVGVGCSTPF